MPKRCARFALDRADFHAVIDGMAMDVAGDIRWPDAATLDLYCDRVASAVGRLSVRIFGMEEAIGIDLAHHLGRALQLTNILRDIDEDAAIGRVYLPREAIDAAGIAVGEPLTVVADSADRPGRARARGAGRGAFRPGQGDPGHPSARPPDRAAADGGGLCQGADANGGGRLGRAAVARVRCRSRRCSGPC